MTKIHLIPCLKKYDNWRTKIIIEQGLKNHPDVELVNTPEESDFIFMNALSFPQNAFSTTNVYDVDPNKLIFIDFWDTPTGIFYNIKRLCYFKRSWAGHRMVDGFSVKSPIVRNGFYPTSMAILDQFLFDCQPNRDIDVGCFFNGKTNNLNRDALYRLAQSLKCNKCIGLVSPAGVAGRGSYNETYFNFLKRSKITLTCQPDRWDGDWRTWEALASGTLTFVDKLIAPIDNPLEDGKHCIFYDTTPKGFKELEEKIYYYLKNEEELKKIAKEGCDFAMKYHRSINRIDSMIKIGKILKNEKKL